MNGGYVAWRRFRTSPSGFVEISFQDINFGELINSLSDINVLNWQGWAVTTFTVDEPTSALLSCNGIHNIELDGDLYFGDIYMMKELRTPVFLKPGSHTLYLHIRAKTRANLKCEFSTQTSTIVAYPPDFLPDIHDGYLFSNYIPLHILNPLHQFVQKLKFRVIENHSVKISSQQSPFYGIAPGQVISTDVRIEIEDEVKGKGENCVKFKLEITADELNPVILPISLRCRESRESFLFTFKDHDNSLAHAAAIRPWDECDHVNGCAVILSLSGVGVKPQNQADSYKYGNPNKKRDGHDYVFGMKNAWVLAPERDGAHNWEGTGFENALKSLDVLGKLTKDSKYKVDVNRVFFAGHSRGGHGALMLGTHVPDISLGVNAAAGWIKRETYGDANNLFILDTSLSHLDYFLRWVHEATIQERDTAQLASNMVGLDLFARVGTSDNSVPPWHIRRFSRLFKEHGGSLVFNEIPGKEHWWWDTVQTNDGGVMFDKELRAFLKAHINDNVPEIPGQFEITCFNPATFRGRGGIRILQHQEPFKKSTIKVSRDENHYWTLKTSNVRRIQFYIQKGTDSPIFPTSLKIDSTEFSSEKLVNIHNPQVSFVQNEETRQWTVTNDVQTYQIAERGPQTLGPARQVFHRPFLIVVGTQGEFYENAKLLQLATYIANSHHISTETLSQIVLDKDLPDEIAYRHNLVLIGRPDQNLWSAKLNSSFPIKIGNSKIEISNCVFDAVNVGYAFTAPHVHSESNYIGLNLVIGGTDLQGMQNVVKYSFASNQALTRAAFTNMVGDYYITGPDYSWKGPGGLLAAGFWANNWEASRSLGYLLC